MTRRQLVLAAALAVAALGAVWWLLSDGLSAEERRLVGTWRLRLDSGDIIGTWVVGSDPHLEFQPDSKEPQHADGPPRVKQLGARGAAG